MSSELWWFSVVLMGVGIGLPKAIVEQEDKLRESWGVDEKVKMNGT